MSSTFDVVTGAFGYTGGAIARRLVEGGRRVRTLTNHPDRNSPLADKIEIAPLAFDNAANLRSYLDGADVLYNTYWVRFEHGEETFASAVENSRRLIEAAKAARVRRIVHISICNPSPSSPLLYYSGKARVEQAIRESGISHAILRPTVIFGDGGILINNIAWFLRKFPVFAVPTGSDCRIQPVFIEDVAELATALAARNDDVAVDAVGPEQFTLAELVRLIAGAVKSKAKIFRANRALLRPMLWMLDRITGDIVLPSPELDGLEANLLESSGPPSCPTRFSDWLAANATTVGRAYASELGRRVGNPSEVAKAPASCSAAQAIAKSSRSALAR